MGRHPETLLALLLAVLASGCATTGAPGVTAPAPRASDEGDGGTANGELVVSGDVTRLAHAYAILDSSPAGGRAGGNDTKVILSDRPLPKAALLDSDTLDALAREGQARAVTILIGRDGKAREAFFHHPLLPAGLSVSDLHEFTATVFTAEAVGGTIGMNAEGFSFSYRASFHAPVFRAPGKPGRAVSLQATPSERARLELEARDLDFDADTFFRQVVLGNTEAVKLFLVAGMPAGTRSSHGPSALADAVERGHEEIVTALVAAGASVTEKDDHGGTLLLRAVSTGNAGILATLIRAGADVNAGNQWKITPLASASEQGKRDLVEILIAAHANLNARDTAGGTALSVAVLRGHPEIVRVLLAAGASVERDKKDLLDAAARGGHPEIRKLLQDAVRKSKPNSP